MMDLVLVVTAFQTNLAVRDGVILIANDFLDSTISDMSYHDAHVGTVAWTNRFYRSGALQ